MNDVVNTSFQPGSIIRAVGAISNGAGLGLYLMSDFTPIVFTKNPQDGSAEYGRFATVSGEFLLSTTSVTGTKMSVNDSVKGLSASSDFSVKFTYTVANS